VKTLKLAWLALMMLVASCTVAPETTELYVFERRGELPAVNRIASSSAAVNTAAQLLKTHNYDQSLAYYLYAAETFDPSAEIWLGIGSASSLSGRYRTAENAFRQYALLAGPDVIYFNNIGFMYLLEGEFAKARSALEKAHAFEPGNQTVENNLRILEAL
jgi:Flp pilus assembly protein TadD